MSFGSDIRAFADKAKRRHDAVFAGVVTEVHRSIVEGSQITGAPGQPVDTGHLRASWSMSFPDAHTAIVSTNVEYAPVIEDNLRGATVRSAVGGFHSVKLTRAGFNRIVENVLQRVTGGG